MVVAVCDLYRVFVFCSIAFLSWTLSVTNSTAECTRELNQDAHVNPGMSGVTVRNLINKNLEIYILDRGGPTNQWSKSCIYAGEEVVFSYRSFVVLIRTYSGSEPALPETVEGIDDRINYSRNLSSELKWFICWNRQKERFEFSALGEQPCG